MTADVVIVVWNGRARIGSCLEHIARQDAAHRVILVDNASSDGSAAMVREHYPHVTLIEMERNVGFGRAVNAGVAAGDGDAIVLVNDDLQVGTTFLEALLEPLERNPAVGMVAGCMTIPGTDLVDGFGIEVDVTLAAYNHLRRQPVGSQAGLLLGPSGGAAAYRRQAFAEAGGFDDRLFAYGEDVDLPSGSATPAGRRPRRRGHRGSTWAVPASELTRPDSATWRGLRAPSCCGATACYAAATRRGPSRSRHWLSPPGSYAAGLSPTCAGA